MALITNNSSKFTLSLYFVFIHYTPAKPRVYSFSSWLFACIKSMKLKVFIKVKDGTIKCICLQKNKKCKRWCLKDSVEYDQYQHLIECFNNKNGEVKL